MWKANKTGIIVLAVGLTLLALAHRLITPGNEQLANQVLALGFCLLLFSVALASWLSVKQPEAPTEQGDDNISRNNHGGDDAKSD